MRKGILIGFVSLATAIAIASVIGRAQAVQFAPTPRANVQILSGSDIGFRVEGNKAGKPVGTLVVRIDGQWVEATFSPGIQPLVR
jgi:hypothetical protein